MVDKKEPSFVNLHVRFWDGEEWPEKRISISCTDSYHAVMISPRYADIEVAMRDAEFICDRVNMHDDLVEALGMAIDWIDSVPSETKLPAMPGFDRDSVDELLKEAKNSGG